MSRVEAIPRDYHGNHEKTMSEFEKRVWKGEYIHRAMQISRFATGIVSCPVEDNYFVPSFIEALAK